MKQKSEKDIDYEIREKEGIVRIWDDRGFASGTDCKGRDFEYEGCRVSVDIPISLFEKIYPMKSKIAKDLLNRLASKAYSYDDKEPANVVVGRFKQTLMKEIQDFAKEYKLIPKEEAKP